MPAPSAEEIPAARRPGVPGVGRLAWLLFMKPLTLHGLFHDWGLEGDPTLWALRGRLRVEPRLRALVGRLLLILLLGAPTLAVIIGAAFTALGVPVDWIGVAVGVAGGGSFILTILPGPFFFIEAPLTLALRFAQRLHPPGGPRLARALPFRWHHIINWPLPGLRGFLIDLADEDPDLARTLIDEAAESFGQQTPARAALRELQARSLERAARRADWSRALEFDLPFLPNLADLALADPLHRYADTAADIAAAAINDDQRRRLTLLRAAEDRLTGQGASVIGALDGVDPHASRLLAVNQVWKQAIADMRATVEAEIAADPMLPRVYVAGPALDPRDPLAVQLFRARKDLVAVIDHDLADDRLGALLLIGQRRMGKTSLLRTLPAHLGRHTIIAALDFQGLSGHPHARHPHRWVAEALREAVAEALPDLAPPALPATDAWGPTLDWIAVVDALLGDSGRRALITVDEVERIQTGIDEGWGTPVFLDFARAAGDRLRHTRLLLVGAHPPSRLGPHWTDRLISAIVRDLGPLPPGDAEGLLRQPIPDFPPEVFDDDAAATALAQTGGHPYLIQLVGDAVVERLNLDRRRSATARDIRRALDMALNRASEGTFPQLWKHLSAEQRAYLQALAGVDEAHPAPGVDARAFRSLRDLHFLVERDGAPAFAFPLFGRWVRDHAA